MSTERQGRQLGADPVFEATVWLSTLLDAASGLAVHSTLPAGRGCPHVESSYRFLRPALAGGGLRYTGEAAHAGRTLAVARAELRDAQRRLVAMGETTHALVNLGAVP